MERDFVAYLFTLFCPLFTSGDSFSIAHEYSVRNLNNEVLLHCALSLATQCIVIGPVCLCVCLYIHLYFTIKW